MKITEIVYNAKTLEIEKKERELTDTEIKSSNIQNINLRINELKRNLSKTDYQAIKFAEGQLTEEEYAETKKQRQAWRVEINQLEKSLEEEPKGD